MLFFFAGGRRKYIYPRKSKFSAPSVYKRHLRRSVVAQKVLPVVSKVVIFESVTDSNGSFV